MVSYLQKHRLDGRVALVTGGGRAIGLACAHALAEAGAHVVIADVDPQVAKEGQSELAGHGFEAEIVDLTVAIAAINVWNRWAVGFRSQHPVGMDKRVG